jgi:thiamine biosynthesis lipoprotein
MLSRSAGQNMYVPVTPALYDLLLQSQKAYILSKGSFDITLGPVTKLWRTARKQRVFPNSTAAKEALNLVGFNKVKIDTNSRTVMLRKSGMQLDAGGIAQGYIAQKVLDFLKQQHITSALIDVSGDIALGEPPPGKEGWNIGVNVPEQTSKLQNKKLLLSNCTVSTSGDVYQYIEHNGRKYSHIVDPKTGYGVTTRRNVTVIAADATTADWLATACSILPIRQAKRLTKKMNAALMIAYIKGERLIVKSTVNFTKYFNTQ